VRDLDEIARDTGPVAIPTRDGTGRMAREDRFMSEDYVW
jgi:hypothetical protein